VVGSLGGPCTSGGGCDVGLVCSDGVCETPEKASSGGCPEGEIPKDCELERDRCSCGSEPTCDHCNGSADYMRCYDQCTGPRQRCLSACAAAYESCTADRPCVICNTDDDCVEPLVCRMVQLLTGAGGEYADCISEGTAGAGGTGPGGSAGVGGISSGGSTASGGTPAGGGTASGGTASGGTASGGTASGGTTSGGTTSGGTTSGGTASGGTTTGGTAGGGTGNEGNTGNEPGI
jgi:hypothetical protein